ncbi:ParB/RepB/Spo0J family partition protein [Bacillus solimangrovi]|uniref:Chromosome partitioning protein ParB n=1 Tax=Bacillus solimangrovi TaxID=1305675 RepID=A0A1E5LD65_9BACI|nr:ParB/RepB/Spo0J family partition protein [Bacillus solimangrovi]OEH91979.1 chromosome partitioning protein ParB [Bacillus solimangrovi]
MAKGLGKGIQAFFPSDAKEDEVIKEINISECRPNPYQPRKVFDDESLEELVESVRQYGVLQPIVVRKSIKGYEIVVGERRFRAAKAAQFETIPSIVRKLTEQEMMEIALIENLQREDLSPIEEGIAYQHLMEQLSLTQEQLAKRIGKSRPHIANTVRILSLPDPIKQMIEHGELTMGHGRALLSLKNKQKLMALAEKVRKENINVRELENMIHRINENVSRETSKKKLTTDVFIKERESILREYFGTSVKIKEHKKKGKIEIEFFSREDLERILTLFNSEE